MKRVFTTGQMAKICRVAPRTISKWFDSGRLKGYRIPGSQDRRMTREQVVNFLKENAMTCYLPDVNGAQPRVLCVGVNGTVIGQVKSALEAAEIEVHETELSAMSVGASLETTLPRCIVIETDNDTDGLVRSCHEVLSAKYPYLKAHVVVITGMNAVQESSAPHATVFRRPLNIADLVKNIQDGVAAAIAAG